MLSLDAMDVSGSSHGDVINNIFKKRLDEDGKPFEQSIKNEVCSAPSCFILLRFLALRMGMVWPTASL